ncbi:MAG: cyclic nucleotide-binding domain-containing protein [Acidimicrobiia bacterium]|nr:cyclic nucleotide-binding domain-containing protein [Acidimicrobiia bacterium]
MTSPRRARSVDTICDELTRRRLRSVALFGDLSERHLFQVAAASNERRLAMATTVVTAGMPVAEVSVVLDGYAGAERDDIPAIVLGPGAVIGAPESLDGLRSPLTIVAQTPLVLRVFAASDFAELIVGTPPLAIGLIRQLGGRTRTLLDELVCARQGSVTPMFGSDSSTGMRWSSRLRARLVIDGVPGITEVPQPQSVPGTSVDYFGSKRIAPSSRIT